MSEPAEHTTPAIASRDELARLRKPVPTHCGWCGQRLRHGGTVGRRRRYCGQSCRQRAYERRLAVQRGGLPEDAVVLSATELAMLQDRLFQLRCAAEDVVTATEDTENAPVRARTSTGGNGSSRAGSRAEIHGEITSGVRSSPFEFADPDHSVDDHLSDAGG
ncbi:hypothetical protein FHU38_002507 [Saccharomonospora amisosensis]|uniref:Uncharacterized protein n=1 Tax=Saccharomonospora amisosensis TaxID=1128677 RepID=A0A7X5UQZ8_9PSEU|nr:hypothetical protein [Saccharomonospora amisosensis]